VIAVMSDPFNAAEFDNDVGLGEEDKPTYNDREEWLKMNKGQVIRASFIYFHPVDVVAVQRATKAAKEKGEKLTPEQAKLVAAKALEERAKTLGKSVEHLTEVDKLYLDEVKFKKMNFHYQNGLGMVLSRLGMDGPEGDAVWKRLEAPQINYSTLLVVYPTDRKGELSKAQFADWSRDPTVIPWRFGPKRYENIYKLNAGLRENSMGLHTQDLKLECDPKKEEKFQNIEVSFVGKAIWRQNPKIQQIVLEKAIPLYSKLVPFRAMTTDQLRAKLGMGGSSVSDVAAGGTSGGDFTDLLDQV